MQSKNRKGTILFLMRFESLKKGSFENFLVNFARYFSGSYNVVIVFLSQPPLWLSNELHKSEATIEHIDLHSNIKSFYSLYKLVKKYAPDVIHLHFFGLLSPFIPFLKIFNCKIIVHIHSVCSYENASNFFLKLIIPIRKILFVKSINLAIAVSHFVLLETINCFDQLENKIKVVYNGLENPKKVNRFSNRDIKSSEFQNANLNIFTAAWLNEIKGIDIFIKSIPFIKQQTNHDLLFCIAGDGPQKEQLENLAIELGIKDSVRFLGWRSDIPELINASDIIVAPSVKADALPYFVIECMSLSKPIVASEIGGIPELISGNPLSGLLFPPGNCVALAESIITLINNTQLRTDIGVNAYNKFLKQFLIDYQMNQLESIYAEFI